MQIKWKKIECFLKEKIGTENITSEVKSFIHETGFKNGVVFISVRGSTGAVTTIEYEPNLLKDYESMMEKIAPSDAYYNHTKTWGDHNGFSHLRSSLQKTSLSVPFVNSDLFIGTWQQIMVINFDERARNREVLLQVFGE